MADLPNIIFLRPSRELREKQLMFTCCSINQSVTINPDGELVIGVPEELVGGWAGYGWEAVECPWPRETAS